MKKKLFTLLVCTFAVVGAKAESWSVVFNTDKTEATITCTEVNGTNGSASFTYTDGTATDLKNASTLIFKTATGVQITSLGAINAMAPYKATTVNFKDAEFASLGTVNVPYYKYDPNASGTKYSYNSQTKQYEIDNEKGKYVYTTGTYHTNCLTFKDFADLTKAVLPTNIDMLCQNCFQNNPVFHNEFENNSDPTTYLIPSNVQYIAAGAFDNVPIDNITIPATVEYIGGEAFKNGVIKNLINVYVKGNTAAATGAFDKQNTVNQTVAVGRFATLHFPTELSDMFVNSNHELDLATSLDAGAFQNWLNNHHSYAGNGWQEFVSSAPGDPIEIPEGKTVVLRTFSDNVAHYVPTNYRAYIVQGVRGSKETGYELQLKETFAIPANTGVIIYGEVINNATGFSLPILSGSRWYNNPYDRNSHAVTESEDGTGTSYNMTNYLVANCNLPAGTKIGPYELGSDGTVAERNFVLGSYNSTDMGQASALEKDYIAFYRAKTMTPGKNKAHLKLPSTIYNESQGYELRAIKSNSFRAELWERDYIQYGDWGDKANSGTDPFLAKSFGEPFEETTGISNVKSESTDDAIYNLQGVKVANPVKGVYVKAGKKIIIK